MKRNLCWSAAIFLFCWLYFIPSKVGADTGVDLLSKCTSLEKQESDKSWDKFRAGKDKFKASRRRNSLKNIKKNDTFNRGYCLGYITASANTLSTFSPEKFCPPKKMTKGKLSAIVIKYISKNYSNSLILKANQLVTRALLNKFSCHS